MLISYNPFNLNIVQVLSTMFYSLCRNSNGQDVSVGDMLISEGFAQVQLMCVVSCIGVISFCIVKDEIINMSEARDKNISEFRQESNP